MSRLALLALLCLTACRTGPVLAPEDTTDTLFHPRVAGHPELWDEVEADIARDGRHRVGLLNEGEEALLARIHLIRSARHSVRIQTFIWGNDETGRYLLWELLRAVKQNGIRVQIIADQMFTSVAVETLAYLSTVDPRFQVKIHNPNATRLRPSALQTLRALATGFRRVNARMHDKVMIVDDRIGLTGGRNQTNEYYDQSIRMNYKDRDVLVVGPEVAAIRESFDKFWESPWSVRSEELLDVAWAIRRQDPEREWTRRDFELHGIFDVVDERAQEVGDMRATFVERLEPVDRVEWIFDDPKGLPRKERKRNTVTTQKLEELISGAQESVILQSPYLVLSPGARALLQRLRAERPQIRIRFSTNSLAATDAWPAYAANFKQKRIYLQDLRLEVYEFRPIPQDIHEMADYLHLLNRKPTPAERRVRKKAVFRVDRRLQPFDVTLSDGSKRRVVQRTNPYTGEPPYLCLHAKSLVVDDRVSYVGSHNLDPRSNTINTEVGLVIEDEGFARLLTEDMERDMLPRNSYFIAIRQEPLSRHYLSSTAHWISEKSPVDLWPIRYASSFELRPGMKPVPLDSPDFYEHWRDVGCFPLLEGLSAKKIYTRLFKKFGGFLTPLL